MSGEAPGTGGVPHEVSVATAAQPALDAVVRAFAADTGTLHFMGSDGQLHMAAQHGELPPPVLAQVRVIPEGKGRFLCKPVTRNYAFELAQVPRHGQQHARRVAACHRLREPAGAHQPIGDIDVVLPEIVRLAVDVGHGVEHVQYRIVGNQQGRIGGGGSGGGHGDLQEKSIVEL